MPELPEVEVCRRGLLPELSGRRIESVAIRFPRLRLPIPEHLPQTLVGRTIVDIGRRGKYLLFDCRAGQARGWLLLHLGMSGNLRLLPPGRPPEKHDHFELTVGGQLLRFSDPRRFGVIDWIDGENPEGHPLLAPLGIEPLRPEFDGDWLHRNFRSRRAPVKTVLMDAHTLVGVGNIYASESLFLAGISPLTPACRIGRERCRRLAEAVRATLTAAIAAGGSSIRDYVHSDGGSGWFQLASAVYDRAGQTCRRCGGTVRQIRQAGRSTYYCPGCQH